MRSVAVVTLLVAAPFVADAKPWKPHPIHVIPGVPLKADDIKPYVPPNLAPEPPLEPSDVKVVEVTAPEAVIEIRPWSSPMVGNAIQGARLPVKGDGRRRTSGGCSSHVWYALEPFGYSCGHEARADRTSAATTRAGAEGARGIAAAVSVRDGARQRGRQGPDVGDARRPEERRRAGAACSSSGDTDRRREAVHVGRGEVLDHRRRQGLPQKAPRR